MLANTILGGGTERPCVCGAGFRRQTQLSLSGTGRQQLHLFQPLRQLPPLLLVPHGRDGRAEVRRAEEKTVGAPRRRTDLFGTFELVLEG